MKILRIAVSALLVASVALLCWMCYRSIKDPIEFEAERSVRESAVVARLIDIRTAQIEYKNQHPTYAGNMDSLIYFVKNAQIPTVSKQGELSDFQLSKGLTDAKALEIIANNAVDSCAKYGIEDLDAFAASFRRDTSYVSVLASKFPAGFNADSLAYVPFGKGKKFEMDTATIETKGNRRIPLFEARVHYKVFLDGLNKQEIINICDLKKKLDKYQGLKVGDIEAPNNNSGNWE